jgi:hypothetical protein
VKNKQKYRWITFLSGGVRMSKWLSVLLIVCFMVACRGEWQDTEEKNGVGLINTGDDNIQTDEEILVESREEFDQNNNRKPLSHTEAERLVRRHIGINNDPNTIVIYDHKEKGNYIIQVYKVDSSLENVEGFYIVNPYTGEITKQLK